MVVPYCKTQKNMTTALKHFILRVGDVVDPSPIRFSASTDASDSLRDAATHLKYGFKTATREAEEPVRSSTASSVPRDRKAD